MSNVGLVLLKYTLNKCLVLFNRVMILLNVRTIAWTQIFHFSLFFVELTENLQVNKGKKS